MCHRSAALGSAAEGSVNVTKIVEVMRAARIPDPVRIGRNLRAPELGPKILFFRGGTALAKTCRELKRYTHNSIHLVTPFDSGGSSAALRSAFDMLSVGDLRNCVMSLADETAEGHPEIYRLFSHRLPTDEDAPTLQQELDSLAFGTHALIRDVPNPLSQLVRADLRALLKKLPREFDLRGASIGNLVIAGGLLENDRDIDAVLFLFSKLVQVRGLVRATVDVNLQLAVTLATGEMLVGQHRVTGKECAPIESPIVDFSLVGSLDDPRPTDARAGEKVGNLIRGADLICFPIGSFYSSVLANVLVQGVGRAISEAICPKVYIPNMGNDPEQLGMSLSDSVARLIEAVRRDAGEDTPVDRILNLVLIDSERGRYEIAMDTAGLKELGVEVADVALVGESGRPLIDARILAESLVSLC
jgi:CofD-related protein of GAK system